MKATTATPSDDIAKDNIEEIVCCVDCCDSIVLLSKETEGGNDTILEAIIGEETMNREI